MRDDGGRAAAGYKGDTRDCVARAFAIASGRPYAEVYALVNELSQGERPGTRRKKGRRSSARTGVFKATTRKLAEALGFEPHVATMSIGSGCTVHVRADELPPGRLVLNLSRHLAAVVDGVLYDTFDCSRGGTRCVYGYWKLPEGS
jgi:hypothetical protein